MAAPTTPVSEEHLQQAWLALHQPAWPATLAETLQDPARCRLVQGYATVLARRSAKARPAAPCPVARQPSRCAQPPLPLPTPAPGWVDRKRAAAGDRDD